MRTPIAIATALLTFAAMPALAQSDAQPYRAAGTEPFWSLSIGTGTIRLEEPGKRPQNFAKPRPIIGFNGERYQGRGIIVDVTHVECNDGMSDRTFHDMVSVTAGQRTLRGCGGEVLSERAVTLLEGSWTAQLLNGRPLARGSNVGVRFQGNRISGNGGCNSFNGSFRFERGRLNAGPLATTRRACVDPRLNAQEQAVLNLLGERLSVSQNRGGKLVLTAPGGRTLTLVPTSRR